MEKEKSNRGLKILVIILILLVVGMGSYIVYDKVLSTKEVSSEEKKLDNENSIENDDTSNKGDTNSDYVFYDVNDLNVKNDTYGTLSYSENYVKEEKVEFSFSLESKEYSADSVRLNLNGDVRIYGYLPDEDIVEDGMASEMEYGHKLLNVHKIVDIASIVVMGDGLKLYMLDIDGNVYKYSISNVKNKNYDVEKIENISNVKKMFVSRVKNSYRLYVIDNNNDCIGLD